MATSVGVYQVADWKLARRFVPVQHTSPPSKAIDEGPGLVPFGSSEQVRFVRFLADGKKLYVAGTDRLLIFAVPTWRVQKDLPFKGLSSLRASADLAADGRLATASPSDDKVVVVQLKGDRLETVQTFSLRSGASDVAFDPSGKQLAAVSDPNLLIWDVASGKQLDSKSRVGGNGDWLRLAWHPSGHFIALSKTDNALELISLPPATQKP